jgi:hypothetical protein
VLAKGSADRKNLQGLGNVVRHGSMRHKFLLLHAQRLINSYDIDFFMLPDNWPVLDYLRHLNWRVGARRVFLQHGVTDKDVSRALHRSGSGFDLVVATSDREERYLADVMGYGTAARALGFPRFDRLTPDRGDRRILFMPTWRKYLVVPSYRTAAQSSERDAAETAFANSTYHRFLSDLFGHERLRAALREHGYVLDFLPHYEIRTLASALLPSGSEFNLVDTGERTVQEAMRGCDLFVTDWSSAAFDVAFLGTPVVYAQFDADEYWNGHYRKGYFDTLTDGFGPVCNTVDQTVDAIVSYLENGCVREDTYTHRAEAFFTHRDQHNSARVAAAIASLTAPPGSRR